MGTKRKTPLRPKTTRKPKVKSRYREFKPEDGMIRHGLDLRWYTGWSHEKD